MRQLRNLMTSALSSLMVLVGITLAPVIVTTPQTSIVGQSQGRNLLHHQVQSSARHGSGDRAGASQNKAAPSKAAIGLVTAILAGPSTTFEWPPGLTEWLKTHPAKPGQCLVPAQPESSAELRWEKCPPTVPPGPTLPIPKELRPHP